MINYENLKFFLRVSRIGIELAGEVNSNNKVKEAAEDYSTGLSRNQQKILEQIKVMELELNLNPSLNNVKKNILKLERLMGCNIPSKAFNQLNIN
jgi:hypothetical protein